MRRFFTDPYAWEIASMFAGKRLPKFAKKSLRHFFRRFISGPSPMPSATIAADEDFGMVPLEAQSFGRPVIAYGKGGSLETVVGTYPPIGQEQAKDIDGITGLFFKEQTPDSLVQAILSFEAGEESFVPHRIQLHARKFDTSVFVERLCNYVEYAMTNGQESLESKEYGPTG
jgi:Glycosyl transferases group 1